MIFLGQYTVSICILVAAAITLPTIYFKDLSGMAKLSTLSVATTIVSAAVLVYMAIVGDGHPEHSLTSPGPTKFMTSVDNVLATSGIFILAYSVQSMIPSATYAMRQVGVEQGYTPSELRKYIFYIVLCSTTLTFISDSAAASIVYLVYGENCEELLPLNFTEQPIGKIATGLLGFANFW
jgi:amino acid permease